MKKVRKTIIAIIIAILLVAVTFMDTWLVFRMTSDLTRESGSNQLTAISGKLEGTINDAKLETMKVALYLSQLTGSETRDALEESIRSSKKRLLDEDNGVFNVYAAGTGWDIIPDFDNRDADYVATERSWYTGAIRSQGNPYVSAPYVDAMTGNICYSVSVMLPDNDTVVALDYTMENIQRHIAQLYSDGTSHAVIVTDEGIIAGCDNEELVGKQMVTVLPDYAGIYSKARTTYGVVTGRVKADFLYENLFATRSNTGWYLIFGESDWELYKYSYIQLGVTLLLSIVLFATIIILYITAARSRKKAENALASKEEFLQSVGSELREPLRQILSNSEQAQSAESGLHSEEFSRIHSAGEKLSEMIEQILSYSSIVRAEKHTDKEKNSKAHRKIPRGIRVVVTAFLVFVMIISLYTNISSASSQGNVTMQKEAARYEYSLSEWIDTQKSILDMFCSVISTNPEMLDDYEGTVAYLNRITVQYPEISVTYIANPELEHTVFMNNGWEPDADWHVEERPWYLDLMASENNWIISAPYYDEQTGSYCVTFAERIYDAATGKFLGNFGIDFFMDKLVDILGDSYSDSGYAFLVDLNGNIINHPYGSYQMTKDSTTSVSDLPYGELSGDGKTTRLFRDYDGSLKILISARSEDSKFQIYVVSKIWKIYGQVFIYGLICLVTFLLCIILVYRLLTDFIRMQEKNKEELKEAADAAIAAGQAKTRFLAQMSHEIRTPINAILGMNEMILRSSTDKDILEYSDNIQGAGKNLLSIINSILDFSRIEDGKMEIIPVKYNVADMIHNLENTISERAKSKSLDLIVDVDPSIPLFLLGDDLRITQVITNLLTNAVKYTETGSVTFSVRNGGMDIDNLLLNVSVQDTGIGICQEDMGKLFESFERLEEKRNRAIEGTGLGMSIVTKLLSMMGSELKVESTYGKGSTFSFSLKQKALSAETIGNYTERISKTPLQRRDSDVFRTSNARILVVDDNSMNRKVAGNLLKLFKIEPDIVSSGQEAIDKVRTNKYHIILLDHMMPKMDGIETLKIMKDENLLEKGTTVIALTANAIVGAREMYLSAGFDDYLSKPIEVQLLAEKLKQYLPEEVLNSDMPETPAEEESSEAPGGSSDDDILEFFPDEEPGVKTFTVKKEDPLQPLKELGLDTEAGLRYCGDDAAFYLEMVNDYANDAPGRMEELEKTLNEKNCKDYAIYVHALKSASRTIGANNLFEQARALEAAAKDEDISLVEINHPRLMDSLTDMAEAIRKL